MDEHTDNIACLGAILAMCCLHRVRGRVKGQEVAYWFKNSLKEILI
jgi:hypothetical protein